MVNPYGLKSSNILLVLLLFCAQTAGIENPRERFLDDLLNSIHNERSVDTLFLLQQSGDPNCSFQDWNPRGIPTLRANEKSILNIKKYYNDNALALVCITKNSFQVLLNILARTFDGMRQERIVLMIPHKPSSDLIKTISRKIEHLQFLHMILLVVEEPYNTEFPVTAHRMKPFPEPHFKRVRNLFSGTKIFKKPVNFQGKVASAIRDRDFSPYKFTLNLVTAFSRKYNTTIKPQRSVNQKRNKTRKEYFDIDMTMVMNDSKNLTGYVNLIGVTATLMIAVPCGKELSSMDIFKEVGMGTVAWSALIFYILFGLVESAFVYLSPPKNGRKVSVKFMNPLVNLRALRALLGQSFPVSNRYGLPIRQLFLLMSLMGTLFGCFFGCELSSFLTKKPLYPQVNTFPELRESNLTIGVDNPTRYFIERELDRDFFRTEVPNMKNFTFTGFTKLVESFDMNFGLLVHSQPWNALKQELEVLNKKMYCDAKDLTIIHNVPLMLPVRKNSILAPYLHDFNIDVFDTGLMMHWIKVADQEIKNDVKSVLKSFEMEPSYVPLSFEHFKWLWTLLGISYAFSIMVFIMEIIWAKSQK
ncbi:uncharacterized protein LOC122320717 [Drosophila ficusphila]|uniref:uncharacterized protein LOC122320717 n=1 Tax=Drosophila ficusphila TaxID=30025 RepID=UPI001C88F7C6|nr:uncharacterized protein LOC122320717 [Drosophila ficusphila]